ncbi:hypothetical protein ESOMN_v1c04290 [Williamsoniiplasma somnilux]|uniref:Uncharacterized protein n=1 Tax=Williamsoniiplasma somnilux TaxID=215578 RepID=A0A2K8P1C8_9MOLU|nr:hypothetical protein [Williamsoniiplasma somnilux]ATZ18811.1 hypothetical protein ESOMN_v1c04290 [Williamsoniiplasma somnilux]
MGIFNKDKNNIPVQSNGQNIFANDSKISNPYKKVDLNNDYLNPNDLNGGQFYQNHRPLKPNFSKQELNNAQIPSQIAKEIRSEKLRVVMLMILGFLAISVALFFIIVIYAIDPAADGSKIKIPYEWQPNPVPMFILMFIGLIFLILGSVDYSHVLISVKKYRGDILMGDEGIPFFMIRNYKALIARPIYMNWICFNIYVWGGIVIGIFYAIKATTSLGMKTEIIITLAILCSTLIVHLIALVTTRARKGNINAYYGYEIVPFDQVKDIRKRTNKISMIIFFIFLAIILCVIVVPYIIIRKNRNKPIIPFI